VSADGGTKVDGQLEARGCGNSEPHGDDERLSAADIEDVLLW